MSAQNIYMEAIEQVPPEIKKQVSWSMGISDRLAEALTERGMTQKDFARKMGKSEAEVSRWMAGLHNFTLSTLAKISSVLEKDLITV